MDIRDQLDLTDYWFDISTALKTVASKTIDNHMTAATIKDIQPKHLTDAKKDIKFLNKLLNSLRPSNFNRNPLKYQLFWSKNSIKIYNI